MYIYTIYTVIIHKLIILGWLVVGILCCFPSYFGSYSLLTVRFFPALSRAISSWFLIRKNRKKSWRYGGVLIGGPPLHHPVVRNDHDFALKPMMIWGSSTFGTPISQFYSQIPWFPFNGGQRHGVPGLVRRQDRFQVTDAYRASKRHSNKHEYIYI